MSEGRQALNTRLGVMTRAGEAARVVAGTTEAEEAIQGYVTERAACMGVKQRIRVRVADSNSRGRQ